MEDYTQFTMRMENTLYERLKESAIKNKRSIAKELEYLTELYLDYGSPEANNAELISLLKQVIETDGYKEFIKTTKK